VVAFQPFHTCAEEIRALRTQLLIRWMRDGIQRRMLAVVSPGQGEGRSYVVANLAVAFSQLGERTLLIDTDLRRPRQHQIFGLTNRLGLSAILSGRADRSVLTAVSDLEMLSVLPAGEPPPNPLELLSRTAFAVLLRELQADFDVVLFDTPPAGLSGDAQTIALQAGSALVLARKDRTGFADTARVIRELKDTGARPLGTALNTF
jgi:chain length determinant protein tyrosine kinase EpsG